MPVAASKIINSPTCTGCDKITGDDRFIMQPVICSIAPLDELANYAQSNTSIVKSSPVKRRLPPL